MRLSRGADRGNSAVSGCPDVGMRLLLSGAGMFAESPVRFSVFGLALPHARVVTRKSVNQNHAKVSPIPSSDCPGSALLL